MSHLLPLSFFSVPPYFGLVPIKSIISGIQLANIAYTPAKMEINKTTFASFPKQRTQEATNKLFASTFSNYHLIKILINFFFFRVGREANNLSFFGFLFSALEARRLIKTGKGFWDFVHWDGIIRNWKITLICFLLLLESFLNSFFVRNGLFYFSTQRSLIGVFL